MIEVDMAQFPGSRFKPKTGVVTLIKRKPLALSYKVIIQQKLSLLYAPAGFGKTALMSQWFESASEDGIDCFWLNLDGEDDAPLALLGAIAACLLRKAAFPIEWTNIQSLSQEKAIALLANALEAHGHKTILFLDSCEKLSEGGGLEVIGQLIGCLPDNVKLVASSRIRPNWNTIELFLQDNVRVLTQEELRFSLTEIRCYFESVGQVDLTDHQVYKLASVVEGWPAIVKLAAVGIRSANSQRDVNQILSGEYELISQFLKENVLSELDNDLLKFVHRTSHLIRLRPDLCNTVCDTSDSESKIQDLVKRGLLKEDECYGRVYSYPRFIASYLRSNFIVNVEREADGLHEKAVIWYSCHKTPGEALYHALYLPNMENALKVIGDFAKQLVVYGEISLLQRFFSRLPNGTMDDNSFLWYLYTWTLIITQKFVEASAALKTLKVILERDTVENTAGRFRPSDSEVKVLEYRIRQALDSEWADPSVWLNLKNKEEESIFFLKEQIELSLGAAYLRKERFDDAYTAFMEARRYAEINETPITAISALAKMSYIRRTEGRLVEAMAICDEAIDLSFQKYGASIPVVAVPLLMRSEIHYEFSNVKKSEEDHLEATRLFEKYRNTKFQVQAIIHGAKLINYYHGPQAANSLLVKAKNMVSENSDKGLNQLVCAMQVKYFVDSSEESMAESILRHEGISIDSRSPSPSFYCFGRHEAIYSSFCRYLIAVGRYDAASAWLTKMLHQAQAHSRNCFCLEVSGLLVLTHALSGNESRLMRAVREMLLFGERASAIQSILDLGPRVVSKIEKFQRRQLEEGETSQYGPSDSYVERLLSHSRGDFDEPSGILRLSKQDLSTVRTVAIPSKDVSVSSLTPRELEVLTLICDGCSNKDIAKELILGEGTVKWHIRNIFGKLNVASRTQAASVGRSMRMFD